MEARAESGARMGWRAALAALLALLALAALLVALKGWLRALLLWVETQDPWLVSGLFILLFAIVSFPVVVGYLLLMVTCGYLLGLLRGLLTVVLGANLGVALAHYSLRAGARHLPLTALLKPEPTRALLRVISGPHAFRLVFFARLTPIPFGIQNTIFAIGNVSGIQYHVASLLGLFPAQVINVYLGSTLRSMHDVFQQSHVTGYIVFALQITIGITLMIWVVQKARKELALALLDAEAGHEGGLSTSSSTASLMS